jgi:hypothetical protein
MLCYFLVFELINFIFIFYFNLKLHLIKLLLCLYLYLEHITNLILIILYDYQKIKYHNLVYEIILKI